MVSKKTGASLLLTLMILLIASITAIYLSTQDNPNKNLTSEQQANLRNQITNLTQQLTHLTETTNRLTSTNLSASLNVHEMIGATSSSMGGLIPTPLPYNYLWITGPVTNTGSGYAYNTGLNVIAYTDDGILAVNITVPLTGSNYGTDNETNAFVAKTYGNSSFTFRALDGRQTTQVYLNIFHEGLVTNWSITPVCWTYKFNVEAIKNEPLDSQVLSLQEQVTFLNGLVTNLTTANLVASLATKEYPATTDLVGRYVENSLFIVGSITNSGDGIAYNAGLHLVGYASNGTLVMDMVVPFGAANSYSSQDYVSSQLSELHSGYGYDASDTPHRAIIGLTIYTPEFLANYTVTPVWKNTP
jgi:hypothetical protein